MTPERRKGDLKELELLDEIHKAEEEIDLFLKRKGLEAQKILQDARHQVEKVQLETDKEARRELDLRKEGLIREAEEKAGRIIAKGAEKVRREGKALKEKKAQVVREILELVLGGVK